jgi:hypothetical protein
VGSRPQPTDLDVARWADEVVADAAPGTVTAFVQVPVEVADGSVDARALLTTDEGRWNDRDRPTLYVASDVAVALTEFARHLESWPGAPPPPDGTRAVIEVRLDLPSVLDLRRADVVRALGVGDPPLCFRDAALARSLARVLRERTTIAAIRTPPMAFLDAPDRWNLVVFHENVADDGWIAVGRPVQTFRLERPEHRDRSPG